MPFYWFALGVLSVWRVTHLLHEEAGPWNLFGHLRKLLGDEFWGELLGCFYCLSLWVAAPFAYRIGNRWQERILLWLSFSGAAILLERMTSRDQNILPADYAEDED